MSRDNMTEGSDYDDVILALLLQAAEAVRAAVGPQPSTEPGTRPGQYMGDIDAHNAACEVLSVSGLPVISEEGEPHDPGDGVAILLDPIDGSDNACRGVPYYSTSICAADVHGPRVAVVADLTRSVDYTAIRGRGAFRNGQHIVPSRCLTMSSSFVAYCGEYKGRAPWRSGRALGAASLELCGVADGTFDAFVNLANDHHGPWDYMAGILVCNESGSATTDAFDRDLLTAFRHNVRRTPLAAANPVLLREIRQYCDGGAALPLTR